MNTTILKAENITKCYKQQTVLDNVSITCEKGKIYGLIGVNGAGKSTLMKCIVGLTFPTAGVITFEPNTRVGCMIEAPAIDLSLSAKDNLKAQRLLLGIPNANVESELLETVGLTNAGTKKAKDFSLGMKQRLGIALALLPNPELLILDEPINGLDPIGVVEIRRLLKKLCTEREMTIIVSSHNLPELYQTATDYFIIHQGRLVKKLTLEQLDEACKQAIVIRSTNTVLTVNVLEQQLDVTNFKVMPDESVKVYEGLDRLAEISTKLVENGVGLTFYGIQGDTLENYFLSLIGGGQHV
ncbi:ATP-binding cassette domain-containing protein [Solibacillus ferritrahens]|uniref:ATP-binding cassette domain-containing protein n=1 Tax=Solibacillus ferritrahens TaxID=3098620 RepID=UPI00300833C2